MAMAEDIGQGPTTRSLAQTLSRATHYAYAQGHRYITVEHALLALTEDEEASRLVLEAGASVERLRDDIAAYLGRLGERLTPGERGPSVHPDLTRIIEYATAAARNSPRPQVSGAVLLAAIIGEGQTVAASILTAQGLTFQSAIDALSRSAAPVPPPAYSTLPSEPRPPVDVHAPGTTNVVAPGMPTLGMPRPMEAQARETPSPGRAPAATPDNSMEALLARARTRVNAGRAAPTQGADPGRAQPLSGTAPAPASLPLERAISVPEPPPPPYAPESGPGTAGTQPPRPVPSEAPRADRGMPPPLPPPFGGSPGLAPSGATHDMSALPRSVTSGPDRTAYTEAAPASAPPPPPMPSLDLPSPPYHPPAYGASDPATSAGSNGWSLQADLDRRPQPVSAAPAPPPQPTLSAPAPAHHAPSAQPWPAPASPLPADAGYGRGYYPAAGGPAPAYPLPTAPPAPWPEAAAGAGLADPSAIDYAPSDGNFAGAPYPDETLHGEAHGSVGPHADAASRRALDIGPGQLVENIPRVMRHALPHPIEVRIAREVVAGVASGMSSPVASYAIAVTRSMSVRLRSPDGAFDIEPISPETQWIDTRLGLMVDDFASWRWTVTPRRQGRGDLQLIVAARTVGEDGVAAETALPDQVITVSIGINWPLTTRRWGGWAAAMIAGAVLGKLAESGLASGWTALRRAIGL